MAEAGDVLMRRGQTGNGARLARLCARPVLSESAVPSGDLFHQLLLRGRPTGYERLTTEIRSCSNLQKDVDPIDPAWHAHLSVGHRVISSELPGLGPKS